MSSAELDHAANEIVQQFVPPAPAPVRQYFYAAPRGQRTHRAARRRVTSSGDDDDGSSPEPPPAQPELTAAAFRGEAAA